MSADDTITTSTGTTVRIVALPDTGERAVMLSFLDESAADLHIVNAGRITHGGKGFKPAFALGWALSTETLRAIADLIDRSAS